MCRKIGLENLWTYGSILLAPIIYGIRCSLSCLSHDEKIKKKDTIEFQLKANWDSKGGYKAGTRQYANVWTRDSFFSLLAPTSDRGELLAIFADRLRRNERYGHIPFTYNKILYTTTLLCPCLPKSCKTRKKPLVSYRDEKLGNLVMDSNSQYIIMVYEAFQISKNMDWLNMHKTTIRNCRNWYDKHVNRRGLIQEIPFGYWEDSLMLSPTIPYTNLLYLKALKCASELLDTPYQIYSDLKHRVTNLVLDKTKLGGLDTVSVSLLALWGEHLEIDMSRVDEALGYLNKFYPVTSMIPNREKLLPSSEVFFPMHIIGQEKYHNGWNWAWVGCLFCAALARRNFKVAARRRFGIYERLVSIYGTLHEVYEDFKPVRRSLYTSEECFSEALGCYLFAKKIMYE
jgi:glycogen debranching enzyme